jgi:CheY-like chemotaxis protein
MGDAASDAARRVLVVEDERAIRQLLVDALTDEGHDVREASSGIAALDILAEWVPDLILLDVSLPEMDGRTFRIEQRALAAPASEVPVILVTGAYEHERLLEETGAAALIRKPFNLDDLVLTVLRVARDPRVMPESAAG